MRAYVVVEGRRTEPKVYRSWLQAAFPGPEALPAKDERNRAATALAYFKSACRARNTRYAKHQPGPVQDLAYLQQLVRRVDTTSDLRSFARLVATFRTWGAAFPPPQ